MIIYIAELYPSTHIHKALLPVSSIVLKDKFMSIHHLLQVRKLVRRKMSNEFH